MFNDADRYDALSVQQPDTQTKMQRADEEALQRLHPLAHACYSLLAEVRREG